MRLCGIKNISTHLFLLSVRRSMLKLKNGNKNLTNGASRLNKTTRNKIVHGNYLYNIKSLT